MNKLDLLKLTPVQLSAQYRTDAAVRATVDDDTSFLPSDCERSRRLYHFLHQVKTVPICPYCGERERSFVKAVYYRETCGSRECKGRAKHTASRKPPVYMKPKVTAAAILAGTVARVEAMTDIELRMADTSMLARVYARSESIRAKIDAACPDGPIAARVYHFKHGGEAPRCACGAVRKYMHNGAYRSTCGGKSCANAHREASCVERYGARNVAASDHCAGIKQKELVSKYEKHVSPDRIISVSGYLFVCECALCGSTYEASQHLVRQRRNIYGTVLCTVCNPVSSYKMSGMSVELLNFIVSLIGDEPVRTSDRTVIRPGELDIYLPDRRIAFEFNGLYWHSELFKSPGYHLGKTVRCRDAGVRLLHVWEDDWELRRPIVESIVRDALGHTRDKVHARSCSIIELSHADADAFLELNHLQGGCPASVRLGLVHNGRLLSVMTFGRPRRALGGTGGMELLRFCSALNTRVIGGASRLFAAFLRLYPDVSDVYSYADVSRYTGGVYAKMGFVVSHESPPNYWYVVDGVRRHRFSFRKDVLVAQGADPALTERETMSMRGIPRIYDCGSVRFDYVRPETNQSFSVK